MYADNETGKRAHRFLNLVKGVGHNTDAYPTVGVVTSTAPIAIYVEKSDIEITSDTAYINPDLLARQEYVTTVISGTTHELVLDHEQSLNDGDSVLVLCDANDGIFYVVCKLTGGG